MLCMYLSNEKLKLIEGRIAGSKIIIKNIYSEISPNEYLDCDLSESKYTVEFTEAFTRALLEFENKGKRIIIVLDNSKIPFSEMTLPKTKPQKLLSIISNEIFNDEKLAKSNTVDYLEIAKKVNESNHSKYFVTYLANDLIERLKEVTKELGLKLSIIDIAQNSISKLMKYMSKILPDTYMLVDYKGSMVTLYLIHEGIHLFSLSKPIIAVPTAKFLNERYYFINEMSGILNDTLEFFTSKFTDIAFNTIYITGDVESFEVCSKAISDQVGYNILSLQRPESIIGIEDEEFNEYTNVLGALIRQR